MTLDLYYLDASPPVRSVLLTGKALDLHFNLKFVDLFKNEHMSPEYLKMNPQHTIPTLVDDGFPIFDSHAIAAYLVTKYGKDDSLYPKDAKLRAVVDQRLHFDSGILFPRLRNVTFPLVFLGKKEIPEERKAAIEEAYQFMEKFLEASDWIAGDKMTIADFCCVSSVSSLDCLVPLKARYPKISAWLERCRKNMVGYDEANQVGLNNFNKFVKAALSEN